MSQTLPDPRYLALFPIQEVIIDKDTGLPLSAGLVYFYEQENQNILKPVYQQTQDASGNPVFLPLNNPITLTSVGTFADDNGNDIIPFLYPYTGFPDDTTQGDVELYFISVYSSGGVLQFTRSDWPPNVQQESNTNDEIGNTTNQLINPQFSEVLFQNVAGGTSYTYAVSGSSTLSIAPGWFIATTGSGSVQVTQVALNDILIPSNPPFALQIVTTGLTGSVILYQRIDNSPLLLAGADLLMNGYVLVQQPFGSSVVTINYAPSDSGTVVQLATGVTNPDGSYTAIQGTAAATPTYNTDPCNTGYVDFQIVLPIDQTFNVTSAQLLGVTNTNDVSFIQVSTPVQKSLIFSYWQSALNYKPIPSYLVGWDFPLNPAQLGTSIVATTLGGTNRSQYTWDQTIAFQSVDTSLITSRNTNTNGMSIGTALTTSGALIQYLPASAAREILSQRFAIQIKGFASTGGLSVSATVGVYWTTSSTLPDLNSGTALSLVSGVTTGSSNAPPTTAVTNGTWNQVSNTILGNSPSFVLTTTNQAFSFAGFDATATAGKTTATYIAIVISFNAITSAQVLTFDYCSLVGGDLATRPSPQTEDEVLRECQYYYEKSFDNNISPNVGSDHGGVSAFQYALNDAGTARTYPSGFGFQFNTIKWKAAPVVTLYSNQTPFAANTVFARLFVNSAQAATGSPATTGWIQTDLGQKGVSYIPTGAGAGGMAAVVTGSVNLSGMIQFHYTVDSRLGVIL